jgi:hypothetical protein
MSSSSAKRPSQVSTSNSTQSDNTLMRGPMTIDLLKEIPSTPQEAYKWLTNAQKLWYGSIQSSLFNVRENELVVVDDRSSASKRYPFFRFQVIIAKNPFTSVNYALLQSHEHHRIICKQVYPTQLRHKSYKWVGCELVEFREASMEPAYLEWTKKLLCP